MEGKNSMLYYVSFMFLAVTVVLGAAQPAFASLLIIPGGVVTGTVGVSSDGCGTNQPPCSISQDVIAGATVLKAFLYGTSVGFGPTVSITVELDGTPIVLTALPHNQAPSGLISYRADVTTEVTTALTALSTHTFSVDDSVGQSTGVVDGIGLVIIYSHASLPTSSVLVFDGGQQASATVQNLVFGAPVDTSAVGFAAEMRLGIGFSAQDQSDPSGNSHCGGDSTMDSQIDVNGVRLTSCAGNEDDAVGAFGDGALFTLGGVGDDLLNPSDPNQRSGQGATSEAIDDDERYDISGFITDGDTGMLLRTENTSFDDNLFLSILYFKTIIVDEAPAVGGSMVPIDTSALLLAGAQSISMWMIPVVLAGIGIGVFVIKRKK